MYREPENLRKTLASCTYYGALDISEKSPIRLPQTMRPAKLPGARGEDLISCLYDLRESDQDRFEWVENILSVAFPDFERLNFPAVAAGTLSMTWTDRNFDQPFYVHELSEGTLRFLWLVTLLQSQNYNKIIDGKAILKKNDLMIAIRACPELKAFVNRIISLCDPDQVIP